MIENAANVFENSSNVSGVNPYLSDSKKYYLSNSKTSLITSFGGQILNRSLSSSREFSTLINENELSYDEFYRMISKYSNNDNDYEPLIQFLDEKSKNTIYAKYILKSFDKLDDNQRLNLILSILSSEMDIFATWYKEILNKSLKSSDVVLSSRVQDILDLYFDKFEEIK